MRTQVTEFINACASSFSDLLTRALRKRVLVQLETLSSCRKEELPDSVMTSPAALCRGKGFSMALVLERQLAFSVLDTLLGGDGKVEVENRPFSDVEKAVSSSFMEKLVLCLDSIWRWGSSIPLEGDGMAEYFSESSFAPAVETLLVAVLNVTWDKSWRKMYLCIPGSDLEMVETVLRNAFDDQGNVPLSAELGSSDLQRKEAQQLGVGDVVCLAQPKGGLVVRAGRKAQFLAQSGAVGDKLAVSIVCTYEGPDAGVSPVTALLGCTKCHWKELLALDAGDVLVLDRRRMSPVPLLIAGEPEAEGEVVVIDNRLGVRIKKLF